MVLVRKKCVCKRTNRTWDLIHQRERKLIQQWNEKRLLDSLTPYSEFWTLSFNMETIKSFIQNINIMVCIHISISTLAVFIFQKLNVCFDINAALFVSPMVFPLAFSINSDFQRREKVLEDLAAFKSAGITWYFCMREWRQPAGLDTNWIIAVRKRVESLLFLLSEYLLTATVERRVIILRAIYEDFSYANTLIESLRASKLPGNSAIVSRSVHCVHMMCLSVERLRVVRDYRSPRSIRSFNKVVIITILITLAPYLVHLGVQSGNHWQPYYVAIILAFIFSTLHGVQDKLDDPFDGIGRDDDINLDTMDEWVPVLESANHFRTRTFGQGKDESYVETYVDDPIHHCQNHCVEPTNSIASDVREEIEDAMTISTTDNDDNIYSNFTMYSSHEINLIKDEETPDRLNCESRDYVVDYSSSSEKDYCDKNENIATGYVLL